MDHFLVATLFIEYYQARAQGREGAQLFLMFKYESLVLFLD